MGGRKPPLLYGGELVSPHVKAACRNAWVHGFDSRHLHEEELLAHGQDSPVLESTDAKDSSTTQAGRKAPPPDQQFGMRGVRGYLVLRSGTCLLDVRRQGRGMGLATPICDWWKARQQGIVWGLSLRSGPTTE